MIVVNAVPAFQIEGVSDSERHEYRAFDPIRQAEMISIRRFIEARRELLAGRILDFGAGKPGTCRKPQPYRDLLANSESEYLPYDVGDVLPNPPFHVVVCTQVLQYLGDPALQIAQFAEWLRPSGILIMTYPTNWPECEESDLWRFTKTGVDRMLRHAGFREAGVHEPRAALRIGPVTLSLGYGLVAVVR